MNEEKWGLSVVTDETIVSILYCFLYKSSKLSRIIRIYMSRVNLHRHSVIFSFIVKFSFAKNIYILSNTIKCCMNVPDFFPYSAYWTSTLRFINVNSQWNSLIRSIAPFKIHRFTSDSLSSTGTCWTLHQCSMIPDRLMWCSYSFDEVSSQLSRFDSW